MSPSHARAMSSPAGLLSAASALSAPAQAKRKDSSVSLLHSHCRICRHKLHGNSVRGQKVDTTTTTCPNCHTAG